MSPSSTSVVCVSGGRGSGKNTHARVAANAILFAQGRVAVLDGDCANPLFGAPGVLTLSVFDEPIPAVGSPACFSERWLRRRAPLAAAFVGPTCARDNPAAYAASLERLLRAWARFRAREDAAESPTALVVNCAGWSKGLGADLVMKTVQLARATHVLRFGAARSLDALDSEGIRSCEALVALGESALSRRFGASRSKWVVEAATSALPAVTFCVDM